MQRLLFVICFIVVCRCGFAHRQTRYDEILSGLNNAGVETPAAGDSLTVYNGYTVKIKSAGDSISHIGLNLFNPEWAQIVDSQILDFIESALLYEIIMGTQAEESDIVIVEGELSDFKNLGPNSSINITNSNARELTVEWVSENGKTTMVTLPIVYETIRGRSRGEIEAAFISKLKKPHKRIKVPVDIDPADLEPYGEEDYIMPGPKYLDRRITRNIYLASTDASDIIWDTAKPTESISNLFSGTPINADFDMVITFIKHEYGEQEKLKTSVENLLAVAQEEGCDPFWGLESFDGTRLIGSLFLYNAQQGYDHVVKIECNPAEIIEGNGEITARAYLYIPTNNVRTLDEPYRIKTEDEKIKYMDN